MATVVPPDQPVNWYQDTFWDRYPWEHWLDGQQWELDITTDLRDDVTTFRRWVYYICRRRYGYKVRTRHIGDKLYIQMLLDEPL
jgi:hypothetical protein